MSAPVDLIEIVDALEYLGRLSTNEYANALARVKDLERLELFLSAVLLVDTGKSLTAEQAKITEAFNDDSYKTPDTIADLLVIIDKALA